ncbi:Desulfoferrodoxin [compost metagenome]
MAKFYICKTCGNLVEVVEDGKGELVCCSEPMHEIKAGTVDAALEKHVPVVEVDGNTVNVTVGSVEHPMLKEHYIQWIYLKADGIIQRALLTPESKPKASFYLDKTGEFEVYEYCNLHGLWKTTSKK